MQQILSVNRHAKKSFFFFKEWKEQRYAWKGRKHARGRTSSMLGSMTMVAELVASAMVTVLSQAELTLEIKETVAEGDKQLGLR
ncbi:hypothetical protein V6N12_006864 [Hibiscus sabdariffa]|uniref:Uncharacterized protein n=1 Tax=Hibiscus sabdariffa TaxID=183260 RepID=A0ABR2F018_9ROSI